MSKRKKRSPSDPVGDAMLYAVSQYLELRGWSVFVIGGCSVVQQPTALAHNYEFVVHFTGKKRADG